MVSSYAISFVHVQYKTKFPHSDEIGILHLEVVGLMAYGISIRKFLAYYFAWTFKKVKFLCFRLILKLVDKQPNPIPLPNWCSCF